MFGRAHGWKEKDFIVDYNSGADPMQQIVSQVSKYWQKQRQSIMLKILNAVFDVIGEDDFAGWANHITDLSSASTTVGDANKMGATTIGDAIQKAVGDNQDAFRLVFMHSKVATNMAGLKLLDFLKYTDANGVERPLRIGTVNGMTVVVDDGCPTTAANTSKAATYTTYVLAWALSSTLPPP